MDSGAVEEAPKPTHPKWPAEGEHFLGVWRPNTGFPNPTQYRMCLHPDCHYFETRPAPRG